MESDQKMLIVLIIYIIIVIAILFPLDLTSSSTKLFDSSKINTRGNVSVEFYLKKDNNMDSQYMCGSKATLDSTLNACVSSSDIIPESEMSKILNTCNHPKQYYDSKNNRCCPMNTKFNSEIKACLPCPENQFYSLKDKMCKSKDCDDKTSFNNILNECVKSCDGDKFYSLSNDTCVGIGDNPCSNSADYDILNLSNGGCVKVDNYIGYNGIKYKIKWMNSNGTPNPPSLKTIKRISDLKSTIVKIDDLNGLVVLNNGASFKNPELSSISTPQNLLEQIIGLSCGTVASMQNKIQDALTSTLEWGYHTSPRLGGFLDKLFVAFGYSPSNIAVCTNDNISYYRTISHMVILYIGFNLGLIWMFTKKRLEFFGSKGNDKHTIKDFLLKITGIFATVYFTIVLISGTVGLFQNSQNIMNVIIGLSLLLVVISMLAIIYMIIPESGKNNTLFKLLKNSIFYIPCLYIQFIDSIKHQLNITTNTSWIILGLELLFIFSVVVLPLILGKMMTTDGIQVLKDPIYINTERTLATDEDIKKWRKSNSELVLMDDTNCTGQPKLVNGEWVKTSCKTTRASIVPTFNEKYVYNYALTFWVYINPQGPNVSGAGSNPRSIIYFEGRPNFMYDAKSNKFIIETKVEPGSSPESSDTSVVVLSEPLLQKWNYVVLNYYGGTLDVFINNELKKSVDGVIPDQSSGDSTITSAKGSSRANLGINGGLCNVVYYNRTLNKNEIYWIYKSLNSKSPPVL